MMFTAVKNCSILHRRVIVMAGHALLYQLNGLNSTAAKKGSVFLEVMINASAIWSRYQRTVLMR